VRKNKVRKNKVRKNKVRKNKVRKNKVRTENRARCQDDHDFWTGLKGGQRCVLPLSPDFSRSIN
jgi:hypothetical protein